jgi:hypothetical protein
MSNKSVGAALAATDQFSQFAAFSPTLDLS